MKENERNKNHHNVIIDILIILAVAIFLSLPLLSKNINVLRDDGIQHIIRAKETGDSIKNLESSKVLINLCNGFGYSWDLFYGNFTSFITGIIYIIVNSEIIAFKIVLFLLLLFSGISMYISMKAIFKNNTLSLVTAIIYMTAPYHLNDMYMRYAIGEFAAFIFIPLVFAGLNSIIKKEENKSYLLLIIGASGLILSHLLSSTIVAIFCFIYLICNIQKLKDKQVVKKLIISICSILLITSYYWIPMIESTMLAKYEVYEENKMSTIESVNSHGVGLKTLLNSKKNFQIHEIGLATIILVGISILKYKKINKDDKKIYCIFLCFGILSIILTTKYINWGKLPKEFLIIQFPWRMLEFSSYFLSVIAGIGFINIIKDAKWKDIVSVILICIILIMPLRKRIDYKKYEIKNPKIGTVYQNSIYGTNAGAAKFEYLPKKAYENIEYIALRDDNTKIITGEANIKNENKNNKKLKLTLECKTDYIELELPYIYYSGYNIYLDRHKIKYTESENGFIKLKVENKKDKNINIEVDYKGSTITKISYLLSITGAILFISLIFFKRKQQLKEIKDENILKKNEN